MVEGIDIGARGSCKRDMGSAFRLAAAADPEERFVIVAESCVGVAARVLRRDFHNDAYAQRLQGIHIEAFRVLDVRDSKANMVNHCKPPFVAPNLDGTARRGTSSCYKALDESGRVAAQ